MPSSVKDLQQELAEQEAVVTEALEVLEEAYAPETTRGEAMEAISSAIDILSGEESEEAEEEEEEEEE